MNESTEEVKNNPIEDQAAAESFSVESFLKTLREEIHTPTRAPANALPSLQKEEEGIMQLYAERRKLRGSLSQDFLIDLQNAPSHKNRSSFQEKINHYLQKDARPTFGSFYIRCKGLGIALNPKSGFLQQLHAHDLFIQDIDVVIAIDEGGACDSELQKLFDLNQKQNALAEHVIHYYLHESAFHRLFACLTRSRLQKDCLHPLSFFADSPGYEVQTIKDALRIHYFSNNGYSLGLKLEFPCLNISCGCLCGNTSWPGHLPPASFYLCDLSAFTHANVPSADTVVLLAGEGSAHRLQKIRNERAAWKEKACLVPSCSGLKFYIPDGRIACSFCQSPALPQEMVITRSGDSADSLHYICPLCILP